MVGCRPEPSVVAELTAWLASHDIPLADLRAGRHRLEDIYLALTSRAGPAPPPPEVVAVRRRRGGRLDEQRRRPAGRPGAGRDDAHPPARRIAAARARDPVLLLVFFSVVDVLPTGDGEPIDFLAPGILALAVMSTAMVSLGIATGFERSYGVLKRLGATPSAGPGWSRRRRRPC